MVIHSADAFAPVGYLRFTRMHTEDKREVRFHLKTSTHFICMHACDDRTSGFLQYSFGKCSFCAEDVWRRKLYGGGARYMYSSRTVTVQASRCMRPYDEYGQFPPSPNPEAVMQRCLISATASRRRANAVSCTLVLILNASLTRTVKGLRTQLFAKWGCVLVCL